MDAERSGTRSLGAVTATQTHSVPSLGCVLMGLAAGQGRAEREADITAIWSALAGRVCNQADAQQAAFAVTGSSALGTTVWHLGGIFLPLDHDRSDAVTRITFPDPQPADVLRIASRIRQRSQDPDQWLPPLSRVVSHLRADPDTVLLAQHVIDCHAEAAEQALTFYATPPLELTIARAQPCSVLWSGRSPSRVLLDAAVQGIAHDDPAIASEWWGLLAQLTTSRDHAAPALSADPWALCALGAGFDPSVAGQLRLCALEMDDGPRSCAPSRSLVGWGPLLQRMQVLTWATVGTDKRVQMTEPTTDGVVDGMVASCRGASAQSVEGMANVRRAVGLVQALRATEHEADAALADRVVAGCAPHAATLLPHVMAQMQLSQQQTPAGFRTWEQTPLPHLNYDAVCCEDAMDLIMMTRSVDRAPLIAHALARVQEGGHAWLSVLSHCGDPPL